MRSGRANASKWDPPSGPQQPQPHGFTSSDEEERARLRPQPQPPVAHNHKTSRYSNGGSASPIGSENAYAEANLLTGSNRYNEQGEDIVF